MIKKEKDTEFDTWMLIEEYEYQANIFVGGRDGFPQWAANRLHKMRIDMHEKIHELLGKDICEFCFDETKFKEAE